jgi:NAD+ kinase
MSICMPVNAALLNAICGAILKYCFFWSQCSYRDMKRIGIFFHPLKKAACSLAQELTEYLRDRHLAVWRYSAWEWEQARPQIEGSDLIISIGGDGTILRAAQAVMPLAIPIVGINLGRLGFMTELTVDETFTKLPYLIDGKGEIDERSVLDTEITTKENTTQNYHALNDVVVARGGIARLINVKTIIDDATLTTHRADGVVISSATGCTGYSLAAGGPVLHPQSPDMVLVPLLPHLGFSYPMVIPSTSTCRLVLENPTPGITSIDGHINLNLACGDIVTIKHSSIKVRFLRIQENSYYKSLEQRLKGK